MKFFKNLFNFYIDSSIHVAIAVCAFVGITILEYNISISKELLGFFFFGTITGYNFVKYANVARFKHRSLNLSLRQIQIFSFFCFLALIYFSIQIPSKTLIITGGFAILTFFYAIPFLNYEKLRNLVGVKIIIVALVWAGVTFIIPLENENIILTKGVWVGFFQRFLFVLVLAQPFEIRDLKYDALSLGTLPQRAGVRSTKVIGAILLLIILLIEFLNLNDDWNYKVSYVLICGVMAFFLFISEKDQSKYFASFWVESIPMLWFIMLFLLKFI